MFSLNIFFLLLQGYAIQSSVKWIVDTNPIVYGNDVTLKCIVTESTCPENYVRRWFGGPSRTLLGLNDRSTNLTKYKMYNIKNLESFGLIIYSFDESDVGYNYTCSCGFDQFTQILSISEIKFIYPVDRWITQQTIVFDNKIISLNFSIDKVYPTPKCRIKLSDLVIVPRMKFIEDYMDNWLLPKVTYNETLNTNQSICDADLQVECWNDLSENFSFVIQKNLHIVDCFVEPSIAEYENLHVPISLTMLLSAFTGTSLIIYKIKYQKKQHYETKTGGEQHVELLNIKHDVDGNIRFEEL